MGDKPMTAPICALLTVTVASIVFGVWQWATRRRTFHILNQMLDQTISGGFSEEKFDETDLSALESKLARFLHGSAAARKTVEQEHMAVKTLVADISHQTRTPIANLLLYTSLISESDLSPEQQDWTQALAAQSEKLSFLIQALVKTSRLEAGIIALTPSRNSIYMLLEEAVEQEEQTAKMKQIVLTALPFQGDAVFDPRWTSEALGNVVNNAVKYTPAGGTVTLSAQMLDSFCRIDVTDTGFGIPESEQAEIFNRFFRGQGTHTEQGLGLGLYLARQIVTLQGGYIKVKSRPRKGSIFSLYLPRDSYGVKRAR